MKKYNIDITELWNHDFQLIETPDGFQKINQLVKKTDKHCYALIFENEDVIECSEDHLIQLEDFEWIKAKDILEDDIVICKDGTTRFLFKKYIGVHNVYDLEVNHENHRYYSENISSHNTGKSTLAEVLLKELKCDAKWINASMDSGIDILRTEILRFASTSSSNDELKVVVMDESDYLNVNSTQPAFRGFLDEFSKNCRFIFTGNYKEKLIEPLLNRLQIIDFNTFRKEEMVKPIFERLKFILENEKIEYNQADLIPIINTYYPSIRGMIGAIQECSITGKLVLNKLDDINVYDKIMKLVSPSYYLEMVKEVNELASPDSLYTYAYKNASNYFSTANYPKVILTLAKYQHMSSSVRDKHLNACACLTELVPLANISK